MAEGAGAVRVVQGGDGGWIFGGAHYNTTWASGRGYMELENLGHGGRIMDVPYGLPGQGRPVDLPGGGMPRTSVDKDGDAGTFSAPAFPGHRGRFGGEKPPPPTVLLMRHYCTLECTEWKTPCHRTVLQGGGLEEKAVSGGLIEGEHIEGL